MTNFKLYEAAINADNAFTVELCRVYGTKACDMRYAYAHTDKGVNAALTVKLAADAVWREEMERNRA
jgi:hypothetical protein